MTVGSGTAPGRVGNGVASVAAASASEVLAQTAATAKPARTTARLVRVAFRNVIKVISIEPFTGALESGRLMATGRSGTIHQLIGKTCRDLRGKLGSPHFLVGTARCAVRAAERRNVVVGQTDITGVRSARWNAGGDIAARCPYLQIGRRAGEKAFFLLWVGLFLLNAPVHWQKVTLVGVGLLGGSLGLALRRRHLAGRVVGFVRRPASVAESRKAGAVDAATCDLLEAVAGSDLIVLCTPISQMRPLLERMLPALTPGAIITDVGSVKAGVVRDLEPLAREAGAHFVGSHPMAGAEKTGVAASRVDLFANAVCVVTPGKRSHKPAARAVEGLWRAVGGRVLRLAPEVHDALVSRSSHLPHVAAAALANYVLDPRHPKRQPELCATGFRDTTRIASGSPEMWRDIALGNRRNLNGAIEALIRDLRRFQRALRGQDAAAISAFFKQAKRRRDAWHARCASPSPE